MRRMATERRLSRLVREGAAVDDALRAVARLLAAHHASAPRSREVTEQGTRDALSSRWEASFAQVRALSDDGTVPDGVEEIERSVRRYLMRPRALVRQAHRAGAGGRRPRRPARRGHLLPRRRPTRPGLPGVRRHPSLRRRPRRRRLPRHGPGTTRRPGGGDVFPRRVRRVLRRPGAPSLRHHYVAYRAFVRAKVSLIQARQGTPGAEAAAHRLITTALRHLRASAVGLTLVGGLPGSGKSTLSGALADRLGVTLLSSDRLRKELAGIPAEQPAAAAYGEGLYSPEWTNKTYAALLDRASTLLSQGESVVLDATWHDAAQREAALSMAERTYADLVALHCHVPDEVTTTRLATRAPGASDSRRRRGHRHGLHGTALA